MRIRDSTLKGLSPMPGTPRHTALEDFSKTQRRSIACGLLTGVVFVSAVVLARRVSGDASPIAAWAACLTGSLAVGIAVLCATVPGVLREKLEVADRLLATGLAAIPGLLLGLSLLPPGSVPGVSSLLGIYMIAVVAGTLGGDVVPKRVLSAKLPQPQPQTTSPQTTSLASCSQYSESVVSPDSCRSVTKDRESKIPTEAQPDAGPSTGQEATTAQLELSLSSEAVAHPSENPQTTQWMSRGQTADGETVEGGCQVRFESGQKLAAVHIPFVPALDSLPEFECEPLDEADVKIKISTRHRYGVRIEVTRLGDLAVAESISLGWFAFAAADLAAEQIAA